MAFAGSCRRCPICLTNWPHTDDDGHIYERCPECDGERTSVFYTAPPIARAEARTRRLRADFDRFYERRGQRPGPYTEEELDALSTPSERAA